MLTYCGRVKFQENFKWVVDPNWAACSNTVLAQPARRTSLTGSLLGQPECLDMLTGSVLGQPAPVTILSNSAKRSAYV